MFCNALYNITIPERVRVPLPKSRDNMVPCAPYVCVITEIFDHSSLAVEQESLKPKPWGSFTVSTQNSANVDADAIQSLAQSCKNDIQKNKQTEKKVNILYMYTEIVTLCINIYFTYKSA